MAFWEKVRSWAEWLDPGKTLFDILVALGVGKVLAAVLTQFTKIPAIWITPIRLLVSAGLFWLLLKLFKSKITQPQSVIQDASIPTQPTANCDASDFLRLAYYSPLTAQVERNAKLLAVNQPDDHAGFLSRIIGIGLVAYFHDLS